jgi:hypothetical protein
MSHNKSYQPLNQCYKKVLITGIVLLVGVTLHAKKYYIDAIDGVDTKNGTSISTAWKSLSKVNSTTFVAGDSILFKANGVWVGQLYPKGSGADTKPIVIDMYNVGSKPLIDGNGMTGTGVVYLSNQQYWEINNLEITNDAPAGGDRRGVRVEVNNWGTANHIYLKNLNIHNIKGSVGQSRANKRTSGIGFAIVNATTESHFNDILVENCVIYNCDNQGIISECVAGDGIQPRTTEWNAMKITNAVIRNNTIYNISKNAMIIRLFDKGVVEHNVCYNTANGISGNTIFSASCDSTIFQYNECYLNNSPDADGSMYDADLRSPNTIWQYSYSHDNAHGLFWTCTVQEDYNVICRYNISQNDKGIIFCLNYPITSMKVYNNTVFIPDSLSPIIISERSMNSGTRTYDFMNNIIYNMSKSSSYIFNNNNNNYKRTIDYNCFYGEHPANEPADAHKITADPKLVNPGSGGIGLNTVDGYKLKTGSPCINAGVVIPENGGKDYWGNPLYYGKPDIGVHEFKDSVTKLSDYHTFDKDFIMSPNPTKTGSFNIALNKINNNENIQVDIFSIAGKNLYSKKFKFQKNISILPNSSLKTGVYFVSLKSGEYTRTQKLMLD